MKDGQDYQSKCWLNATTKSAYDLVPSQEWSSDPWYDPTQPRHFMPTEWKIYNAGKASGTIIGGNLSTFGLLRGTPYAPTGRRLCPFFGTIRRRRLLRIHAQFGSNFAGLPSAQSRAYRTIS